MTYAFGIDLSKYQCSHGNDSKLVDFDAIAAHSEKVSFIFARASLSYGYVDPRYAYYKAEARRVGIPFGSYLYCYPAAPVIRQMETFVRVTEAGEGSVLALDLENYQGMTKQQITTWTKTACEYLKGITGRYPIIYSRTNWIDSYLYTAQLPAVDWWLADYKAIPVGGLYAPENTPPPDPMPMGVNSWMFQQTGGYTPPLFNVASRTLDYDRWNGDEAAVLAYFGYDGAIEPPPPPEPPDPDEPLFVGVVTAEPYLNLRDGPGIQYEDIGNLYPDETVNVYEILNGWYRVDGGWCSGAYIRRDWGDGNIQLPALYSQKDARWRYEKLGTSASTIGGYGCAITSTAMVCKYYGKDTNPSRINKDLIRVGGYENHNLIKWWMVPAIYPDLYVRDWVDCEKVPAPLALIDARLDESIPVIVKVDYYPGGAVQQHWVLIVGKQGDDYVVADPISGELITFRQKYGSPERYIFRVVTYARRTK